jgi:hypothetical protein
MQTLDSGAGRLGFWRQEAGDEGCLRVAGTQGIYVDAHGCAVESGGAGEAEDGVFGG